MSDPAVCQHFFEFELQPPPKKGMNARELRDLVRDEGALKAFCEKDAAESRAAGPADRKEFGRILCRWCKKERQDSDYKAGP